MKGSYSYSSTQANFPLNFARELIKWGNDNIPNNEIYEDPQDDSYGREDDIHCTVLYGLHEEEPIKTRQILKKFKPFEVFLGKLSIFNADNYDVIKIDVHGEMLHKMHYTLDKNIKNENSWPDYKPHVTIGYVQPGIGKKYVGIDEFRDRKFLVKTIIFSSSDGKKIKIKL